MKFLIACDAFGDSLSTFEAGEAAKQGVLGVKPDAQVKVYGLADGGKAMYDVLNRSLAGDMVSVRAHDAVGKVIQAEYAIANYQDTKAAIINAAGIIGVERIKKRDLDPYAASSQGLGEVIKDAIKKNCRTIFVALGGSATNDCGLGMLRELGFSFTDSRGYEVLEGCEALCDVYKISGSRTIDGLSKCKFIVSYDIDNPLCGENGATFNYASSKGAADEMLNDMDQYIEHFARMTKVLYPLADVNQKGAGASGGLGFAFATYLNAKLATGIEIISEITELEQGVSEADYIITGEGRTGISTEFKKQCIPTMLARLAKKYNKPVVSFTNAQTNRNKWVSEGIDACYNIVKDSAYIELVDNSEAIQKNMAEAVGEVVAKL